MTRARCVLGSDALRQRFDDIRTAVITAARDPVSLRGEIMAMRDKVRLAHPVRDARFDLKHSAGGMIDAEFAAQYLVLAQSGNHPELIDNVGNIALLERAEAAGLLAPGIGHRAADAYRQMRRLQHHARLNEESGRVPSDELPTERAAVQALWQAVFDTPVA